MGLLLLIIIIFALQPGQRSLQQSWLLPLQPLPEEAQLWEMQKRGISLAGGHELFQLRHLLGVHSATLLPVLSLWSKGGTQFTQDNYYFDPTSLPAFATLLQTSMRAPALKPWYANARWLNQNAPHRVPHFIRSVCIRQHGMIKECLSTAMHEVFMS